MNGNSLKILMIHPHDIYSTSEPWTIRITSIAHEFTKKGHFVKLIYFPLPLKKRGKIKIKKIKEFTTIPFNRNKWYLFSNILKMIRLGKWADIIHFQKCFAIAALPALFSAYINNKPIHYDWDDWEYGIFMSNPPSLIYGKYLNIMEKNLPKLVDSISVSSEELRKMAIYLGFPNKKIVKVHVCADLNRFNPALKGDEIIKRYKLKKPIVLYLGQLHGAQYAQLLINAIRIILKQYPQTTFVIAGGGADLIRLKHLASRLGYQNKVVFTGYLADTDVNKILAAADIAVACFANTKQVRCKSPLKIAEYLASGKAIVASAIGETPWMLSNAAILTRPGDHFSLAKGIIKLLENEELRKKLEIQARKRAENVFKWSIVADRLLDLYKYTLGYVHKFDY